MEILLTDINNKNHIFNLDESIRFPDEGVELKADIRAKLSISQQKDDAFSLCGALKARVVSCCGRCGNPVQVDIEQNFQYQLLLDEEPQVETEHECTNEDCELLYLAEPLIESNDILLEQLLLALPVQMICDADCKGLCDQCGINLNKEKCSCRESNQNSPFAILKEL
ncbi:MAG: DUF177 domain-containing protein [Desulfocapsa sp.]|nr:DUF177 domain-containing protein [Desulfocapsa sp.]